MTHYTRNISVHNIINNTAKYMNKEHENLKCAQYTPTNLKAMVCMSYFADMVNSLSHDFGLADVDFNDGEPVVRVGNNFIKINNEINDNDDSAFVFSGTQKFINFCSDMQHVEFEIDFEPSVVNVIKAVGEYNIPIKDNDLLVLSMQVVQIIESILLFEHRTDFVELAVSSMDY